jgi:sec-independent protein translocase protein TatA
MGFRPEFLIPLAILALLFFGPKRLPEVGSSIGKTIREFQKSMREVSEPHDEPTPAVAPPTQQPQVSAPAAATEAPQEQGHAGSVG